MRQIAIKTPNGYYGLLMRGVNYTMIDPPDADGNYRILGIERCYVNKEVALEDLDWLCEQSKKAWGVNGTHLNDKRPESYYLDIPGAKTVIFPLSYLSSVRVVPFIANELEILTTADTDEPITEAKVKWQISPLLSTQTRYDTKQEAERAMNYIIDFCLEHWGM